MPKTSFVEKTIFELEGVKVDFYKDGKNVRGEVMLPSNYSAERKTKNAANVSFFINKLKSQYPGYDFVVYKGDGEKARGAMLMATVRDTYDAE